MSEFSPYTPLYHEVLDNWGVSRGTRVWDASGSFVKVEDVKAGDLLFGVAFRLEDDYLPLKENPTSPRDNLVKVWRPILVARRVLEVSVVKARGWQLTFGEHSKAYESRRLVAGADTNIQLFPITHEFRTAKPLVSIHTAVDNPRTGSLERKAMQLDVEASQQSGKAVYRPTPFTGQPCGESVTVIPYEAYGGQTGMLRSDVRPYNRYLYTQCREIVPIMAEAELYQLKLTADTKPEAGILEGMGARCNFIAQTPFAPENNKRKIALDGLAQEVDSVDRKEDFEERWNEWAKKQGSDSAGYKEIKSSMQGGFYETQNNQEIAKQLEDEYGITGGFLNGGILIDIPVHQQTDDK